MARSVYNHKTKYKEVTMSNNKTNPNEPITAIVETSSSPYGDNRMECITGGLTKREYFAGLAMQGLINKTPSLYYSDMCQEAVQIADGLIKALNNDQQ